MKILGLFNATDSGAALIVDGKIVAAANEERFTRTKQIRSFPNESISYVLGTQGISVQEIDWVGCGAWNGIDNQTTLLRLVEDIFDQLDHEEDETRAQLLQRCKVSSAQDQKAKDDLLSNLARLGILPEKVLFCDHHYSHAITAYYCSPFAEAIVFTADGRGDFRSVTLWSATRGSGLQLVDFATELTSPGSLYGMITKHLGFTPDRHEGKVTGLAARGKHTPAYEILKAGFFYDEQAGRIRSRIGANYRPFLSASIESLRNRLSPYSKEDIAWAVQKILEETLIAFLMKNIGGRPENSVDLCLAGGCMGNVKLNYELSRLNPVRNIYVFPQMGDGGNALGGALNVAIRLEKRQYFDLRTVYLGPEFTAQDIEAALEQHQLPFKKLSGPDKIQTTARLIAEGNIVGWFQGRMEYGPRALGARSILAEATQSSINDSLNVRLQRSEFMPFAPVTIESQAARCFQDWRPDQPASRFMTTCYLCTPLLKEKCPAVVHVDDTARPQVVFRADNPEYHDVIEAYVRLTDNPAIINTSFNHHEEPILCSPGDAARSFLRGNVDALIIGDYWVDGRVKK